MNTSNNKRGRQAPADNGYAPMQYEEGFTSRTMLGALFIGIVMVPGSMYLGLVAGASLSGAAEWVTIILFVELAKRSFTKLKRQEVYLLYYVAVALMMSEMGNVGPLWNQYFVQSDAVRDFGLTHQIPRWVAPPPGSEALATRTLFHRDWAPFLLLMAAGIVMSRIAWFSMAYLLFRLTSDVERLPFPIAPIAAGGATALAESSSGDETWRWRVFSVGAVVGMAFGFIYVGIPTFTGAITGQPLFLLPIPWVDLTAATENILPATAIGFTCSLGAIIVGFVLPFWVVVGTVAGALISFIANPILHSYGLLPSWHPGMDTIQIMFVNNVDFWMSFGMGTTLAVAVAGIISIVRQLARVGFGKQKNVLPPPPGRGDFPLVYALGAYIVVTTGYIALSRYLVPNFPVAFFIFFGFIFTPINSYINARMIGMTGQFVGIPFVQEGTYILSGYKGVDIWFAPIPVHNYGAQVQKFREMELTGTTFTSFLKVEAFMIPIILVCSVLFWSFLWKLGPIPSPSYPFAQKMWRLQALNQALWISGTASSGVWVAPEEGGVRVYERGKWETPLGALPLEGLKVRAITPMHEGKRWLATDQGLFVDGGEGIVPFEQSNELPSQDIRDVQFFRDNRIWVAAAGGGAILDGTTCERLTPPSATPAEAASLVFTKVLQDPEGNALFLSNAGLYLRGALGWTRLDEEIGIQSDQINDLMYDRSGWLWICSTDGIRVHDGRRLFVPEGMPEAGSISAMAIDDRDVKYFAATDSLLRYDGAWTSLELPESARPLVSAVLGMAGNELWLCAANGIYRREADAWKEISGLPDAPAGRVAGIQPSQDQRWLLKAIKPKIVASGFGIGILGIGGLSFLGLPVMLIYGFIRSLGSIPHMVLPEIIGALLGRYYFARKFGPENWSRYTPVLAAGFACGMGLIGMTAVAVVLAAKSVISAPF